MNSCYCCGGDQSRCGLLLWRWWCYTTLPTWLAKLGGSWRGHGSSENTWWHYCRCRFNRRNSLGWVSGCAWVFKKSKICTKKHTHNTQYLESDQWYFSGSVSDGLPKCHNCQNAPVWYLCKIPSNSQFYAWLVFCMYWTFIKVEQHSWQINQFKNANEIVSCIEYANVTL